MAMIAEEVVREASRRRGNTSTYAEFRTRGSDLPALDAEGAFWRYVTARARTEFEHFAGDPLGAYLLDEREHRVLSKATNPAGGFTVPSDFDEAISSSRRARNIIGALARVLDTDHGRPIPFPTVTAHGAGAWTAENAAVVASDDTFGQVTVNAFKGSTKTIVSEELADDAAGDFDRYLSDELGQRLALLEESAFAQGDGSGKPIGVVTATNGVAVVTAAVGSSTGFKLADVRSAWAALPDAYKPGASWIMSPSAFASLANLTDSSGALVLPNLHATEPSLYSRPVFSAPELPAAAASARSVVVGDFRSGYAVRRVRGLGVKRQEELHSDSGQIGYRLFARLDGRVVLADALRVLAHSAT
jgi:HK97 family phage major capsid protein